MQLKFLKAGSGDCIIIHHNGVNILVDGGNDETYLFQQIDPIFSSEEFIDLIIITHHDDDHINGVMKLLHSVIDGKYKERPNFIKRIIFNSTKSITKKTDDDRTNLSYSQAHIVEQLLFKLNLASESCNNFTTPIPFGDDLTLTFHAPFSEDLARYVEKDTYYLSSDYRCDWKSPMQSLDQNLDDDSQDKSLPNKTSIVITVECQEKKILLTGDITPDRFQEIILSLVAINGGNAVKYDYIKLPHHGSYKSLNKIILQNVICKNFIIQTNSSKYYLPNKRALLKVLKYCPRTNGDRIKFLFNYPQSITNLGISNAEKKAYSFELEANNNDYGILIG